MCSLLDTISIVTHVPRERPGVAGESQGAALGIKIYLRDLVKVITSWVGFLPSFDAYPNESTTISQDNPLLMINAEEDQLVPIQGARLSYDIISIC